MPPVPPHPVGAASGREALGRVAQNIHGSNLRIYDVPSDQQGMGPPKRGQARAYEKIQGPRDGEPLAVVQGKNLTHL